MKIVFLGTPVYAAACLEALLRSRHEVLAICTQPDKASGRGNKMTPSAVKELALAHCLPCHQPKRIKSPKSLAELAAYGADIFITAAYGQILNQDMLDLPRLGCINVHASLLPNYRGASPIQQAIINGDSITGVTIMQMDTGIDTGDILLQHEIPITNDDTGGSLHDKLCLKAPLALLEALDLLEAGKIIRTPQNSAKATHAPIIEKEMGRINWQQTAPEICQKIRAFDPWPGSYTLLDGGTIKIWSAVPSVAQNSGQPGKILQASPKDGLHVACGDSSVQILEIQPQGGRRMKAKEYLRGRALTAGSIFA